MIVHETPGLIDIISFKSFGTNVKPQTKNPIGYFGTGLKYAIAVLVRLKQPLTIWIGDEPHEFFSKKINFRGKEFDSVYMRRKRGLTRRWFTEQLPFTTELGKNWELWMAFRELHANTLDEKGQTYEVDPLLLTHAEGRTYFEVDGEDYRSVYLKRDEVFLPHALDPEQGIQIFPGKSEYAYYRGLKAHKLQKPSLFTYNFNRYMELTEDRTLKDSWSFDYYLRQFLLVHEDVAIHKQIMQAGDDTYEGNINWREDDKYTASPTFISASQTFAPKRIREMFYTAPPRVRTSDPFVWHHELVQALKDRDFVQVVRIIEENTDEVIALLERKPISTEITEVAVDDMSI